VNYVPTVRETSLLNAMGFYMARFRCRDVNLIEALNTRKNSSQLAVEMAMYPWKRPEPHRSSTVLSHLRSMGYHGNEDTLEQDVRSLERTRLLVRDGSYSYRPATTEEDHA